MVAPSSTNGAVSSLSDPSPFHAGEQRAQTMTGSREISEQLGRAWHGKHLGPPQAEFFAKQQLLYTATKDSAGRLWASVLAGSTGFLGSTTPSQLSIKPFRQFKGDPAEFKEGYQIGTLGIVLETRQRERLNGVILSIGEGKLVIDIQQNFGGCPKYIQARRVEVIEDELQSIASRPDAKVTSGDTKLSQQARDLIERADTLFLATCYQGTGAEEDGVSGNDISHRGGPPGFVQVAGDGTLTFADYVGNFTFTTLGNLLMDPSASIQLLDFLSGDSLQLSGKCHILWQERELPGAERTMEFVTERWVYVSKALPLKALGEVRASPYNPLPSMLFDEGVGQERLQQLHNNYVAEGSSMTVLRCLAVEQEAAGIRSFHFELYLGKGMGNVLCQPGQFASFDFPNITPGQTLNRTWTISSPTAQQEASSCFSITVKKAGLVSGWLFGNMRPGRTVCFRGVDGEFTLKLRRRPKVLFIAGGIGITPLRAMFHQCVQEGVPATLLYFVRAATEAAFLEELRQVAEGNPGSSVVLAITGQAGPHTAEPEALRGRVTAKMLRQVCPDLENVSVFQCGPAAMMRAARQELASLAFPMDHLHQELFNF